MRLVSVLLLCCFLTTGCKSDDPLLRSVMDLRKAVLEVEHSSFTAVITADYGNEIYTFQMDCEADSEGSVSFIVTDPETITGITGHVSKERAALTYDDRVLAFPKLADDQLAPVIGPWIFFNTLRSGYISGCGREEDGICIYMDDSYEENMLQLQIYTDESVVPIRAEIFYKDRRILSMDIRNFTLQ